LQEVRLSELDQVPRPVGIGRNAYTGDAVGPICAQHSAIVDDEHQQVAVAVASERLQLDNAWPPSTVFDPIVDLDLQAIRAGKSNQLERRPSRYRSGRSAIPARDGRA